MMVRPSSHWFLPGESEVDDLYGPIFSEHDVFGGDIAVDVTAVDVLESAGGEGRGRVRREPKSMGL